jgi:hypothetical protein
LTPQEFLEEVARPNAQATIDNRGDLRLAVNAIMSLDAFFGILHASLFERGTISERSDDVWKDQLTQETENYRLVRDTAYSLKHGKLDRGTKARLVRGPDQLFTMPGAFQADIVQRNAFQTAQVWISTDANDYKADEVIRSVVDFACARLQATT